MLNFGLKLAKIITYIFSVWFHGFPLMLFVDFWLKIPVLDCELLKVEIGTLFSFKWMSPPFKEALYVFLWVVRFFDYNNFLCPSAHGNIPPPQKKWSNRSRHRQISLQYWWFLGYFCMEKFSQLPLQSSHSILSQVPSVKLWSNVSLGPTRGSGHSLKRHG